MKQHLVAVLERPKVDVLFELVLESIELVARAGQLFLDGFDRWRKVTFDPQDAPFLQGEGGALVAQRVVEDVLSGVHRVV